MSEASEELFNRARALFAAEPTLRLAIIFGSFGRGSAIALRTGTPRSIFRACGASYPMDSAH